MKEDSVADRVQIKGHCCGYKSSAVFEIEGQGTWQQAGYAYEHNYQYAPEVLLDVSGTEGR